MSFCVCGMNNTVRILVQWFLTSLTQLPLQHNQYANNTHSPEIRNFVRDNAHIKARLRSGVLLVFVIMLIAVVKRTSAVRTDIQYKEFESSVIENPVFWASLSQNNYQAKIIKICCQCVILSVKKAFLFGYCSQSMQSCHTVISWNYPLMDSQQLTPWNWGLLQKRSASQPDKQFPKCYGTRRFIAIFTLARH
jgi:hypothetical protein